MKHREISRRAFLSQSVLVGAGFSLSTASLSCANHSLKVKAKPNIIYILTDQWRAQATGYAGDPNVKTPHLDGLAMESVNFQNAVSVCPICTPHRASLMTGKYPLSTGMFLNDLYLPSEELCMAEIFKQAGYDTAYIGKWHLDGHGRDQYIPIERRQGFDYWKVLECSHNYNQSYYYAGDEMTIRKWQGYDAYAQTEDAQQYVLDHAKKENPFLLVVAYGGPHPPHHTAPKELKKLYPPELIKLRPNVPDKVKKQVRAEAQGFYAHCTAIDQCVGKLLRTLKQTGDADNTIFVFTSDHGEMLGSQANISHCFTGSVTGKQRPWDESIRVPFLLRFPAMCGHKGSVVKAPINTPDILPTLLSLAGIAIPGAVEGEDLSKLVFGQKSNEDRSALVMSVSPFGGYYRGKEFRGVRTSRYTYVRDKHGPWLMYDNETDPYQMENLAGNAAYVDLQKLLEDKLKAKLKQTGDKFLTREYYLKEWGYRVGDTGEIPYYYIRRVEEVSSDFKVQSPSSKTFHKD